MLHIYIVTYTVCSGNFNLKFMMILVVFKELQIMMKLATIRNWSIVLLPFCCIITIYLPYTYHITIYLQKTKIARATIRNSLSSTVFSNFAPIDYHFLRNLNNFLQRKKFNSQEALENVSQDFIASRKLAPQLLTPQVFMQVVCLHNNSCNSSTVPDRL